jgi:uncharacterized LabA/DUF88 family protein
MVKIKKTLYVDLSNLYGGISELLPYGSYFNFADILKVLKKSFVGIDKVKVYGAYIFPDPNQSKRRQMFIKAQNEFFNSAKDIKGVHFSKGYISKYKKEKGVDMMLGVDIINDAHNDEYSDAILLSGDADFVYVVNKIKGGKLKKNFHYCTVATRYSPKFASMAWHKVVLDYGGYFPRVQSQDKMWTPKKLQVIDLKDAAEVKSVP